MNPGGRGELSFLSLQSQHYIFKASAAHYLVAFAEVLANWSRMYVGTWGYCTDVEILPKRAVSFEICGFLLVEFLAMYWQAPEQDNKPPLDECYQLPGKREIFREINLLHLLSPQHNSLFYSRIFFLYTFYSSSGIWKIIKIPNV